MFVCIILTRVRYVTLLESLYIEHSYYNFKTKLVWLRVTGVVYWNNNNSYFIRIGIRYSTSNIYVESISAVNTRAELLSYLSASIKTSTVQTNVNVSISCERMLDESRVEDKRDLLVVGCRSRG